jgi:hypothetical protein
MTARPSMIFHDADGLSPDMATVNGLARMALAAGRLGLDLRLRHASPELRAIIVFAGLGGVLGVEMGGEPEQPEQRVGVEEERQLGDASL